ncbi:PREDICTED: probable receptor-like protein kinase At5g18500 isoform X2 [Ipomoea nil]|uniref:probable receptor-like protein kinase At5g18500 isoform X2 n=1 Tax=Ipomoea nil TaxID=35883 RepID=UPI0009017B15|nr:PREDICTED: probable receptor-like protein kinase At5g18500 isoform X2 [Ipomoea nil]
MASNLSSELSKRTTFFHLKVWVLIAICAGLFIVVVLLVVPFCLSRKKFRKNHETLPTSHIPPVSKEIRVDNYSQNNYNDHCDSFQDTFRDKDSDKLLGHSKKTKKFDDSTQSGTFNNLENNNGLESGDKGNSTAILCTPITGPSSLSDSPKFSQLSWGHWFTLRDLEVATNKFSKENIIGEGGYGIVYRGQLVNGTLVAIKKLLNNLGQAEREFRVEVEAIGHVRHKHLVRLLGYCIEGTQRLLVYEYINNGNLEQWLHGAMRHHGYLTWEARMKVLLGTAKALAYLHEAIEPKVVHRDIKSSNILIDDNFNAKISDFGLAKMLGAGKSYITTRVMGTFGFGVLLLEAITGRDPVDYGRPADEVNLVDWLKMMVASKRSEEVVDPFIDTRPSTRAFKRALLTALRCVDPDAHKRPTMSQVVRMLESEQYPIPREGRKQQKNQAGSVS